MTELTVVGGGKGSVAAEPQSNGQVTRERYRAAVAFLKSYKFNTGSTWAEVATAIGGQHTASTVSVFAGGNYPLESAHGLVTVVEQFKATIEERASVVTKTAYVDTSLSRRMLAAIKKAVLLTKIIVIDADSGTGKSKTLQWWWAQHPRAIYCQANATFKTTNASTWPLLAKVLTALGHDPAKNQKALAFEHMLTALRGTGRPLIVDRAQCLEPAHLNLLSELHEEADIPVVFGVASNDRGSGAFATAGVSFNSRALRVDIRTADITQNDVEVIAAQLVGVDVARDAAPILLEQARAAGGFRQLVNILQLAQTRREGKGKVLKAHVLAAIKELAGGDR